MLVVGSVAVMVTGPPTATPVATPLFKPMVAMPVFDEVQFADVVRFCVLLSVYVPVAVNACVRPLVIEGLAGVTAVEHKGAAANVSRDVLLQLCVGSLAVVMACTAHCTVDAS